MPEPGWWEALFPDPARIVRDVGVAPGMMVVDLCSGDGWFTLALAQIARTVVAIDIDARLLGRARIRLSENGVTNAVFIEASAYDIARLVRDRADHMFLANAFHGVPDRLRLTRAIHDILRPGGSLVVVNWHARPREETIVLGEPRGPATELRLTPEATVAAAQSSGLEFHRVVEIPPYHYAAVFMRMSGSASK